MTHSTTNYDTLFENAFDKLGYEKSVVYNNATIINANYKNKTVLKCHGDCNNSKSIIITESDYEAYHKTNINFINIINNALNTETILFMGYSFSDPDINNILSNVVLNNDGVVKSHYLITDKKSGNDGKKQLLWEENLKRYGINVIYVNNYSEINIIIDEIYKKYMCSKIMISGSFEGDCKEKDSFVSQLGFRLLNDLKEDNVEIISGNGKGIGNKLYEGIAEAAANNQIDMSNHFHLYPFSEKYYGEPNKTDKLKKDWNDYRTKMINNSGILLFIYGFKEENGKIINASGVKDEFNIAHFGHKYVFPINQTGYMSAELSNIVLSDFEKYNGNNSKLKEKYIELIGLDIKDEKFFNCLIEMIKILI